MKYIRTKDGVYKKSLVSICELDGIEYASDDEMCYAEIIKQADTIEELCDEFVMNNELYVDCDTKYWRLIAYPGENVVYHYGNDDIKNGIYGAIWTDKGLIYVAKMNEKGEFELLWVK